MKTNQISDCENQSEKTLAQRIREEKNCFIVKNGKTRRHNYQKPWNQETERFDIIQCEKCGKNFDGCCSIECKDFATLPLEELRVLRKDPKKVVSNTRNSVSGKPRLIQK